MLHIDTTKTHRGPAERRDLVYAVIAAGAPDEDDSIEWKSWLDLSSKDGIFHVARAILAFSNRNPTTAARTFKGDAYLIIGAEPGRYGGVEELDLANVDDKLRPYLGNDAPGWSPLWVHNDAGDACLVIAIDPPRPGDPIRMLRKGFDIIRPGTIYVRHAAKSEPHNDADLDMLQRRLLQQADRLAIHVELEVDVDKLLAVLDISEEAITAWSEAEYKRVMAPLVWKKEMQQRGLAPHAPLAGAIQGTQKLTVASLTASLSALSEPDRRTEADFIEEVEAYLGEARAMLPEAALAALSEVAPPMRLVLVNDTERNFSKVAVDAFLRGPVVGIDGPLEPVELPAPPRPFGTPTHNSQYAKAMAFANMPPLSASIFTPAIPSNMLSPTITNLGDGVRIEFPSVHLRPRARVPLDDVVCIAIARTSSARESLLLEWTATASDADGEAGERFKVGLGAAAFTPLDLFAENDDASE